MIAKFLTTLFAVSMLTSSVLAQTKPSGKLYELRSYISEPGRQADVLKLIAGGGTEYMKKHNLNLVAVWTPVEATDERVFTLVSHKDKASCDAAWAAFQNDTGWKEVVQKSDAERLRMIERRKIRTQANAESRDRSGRRRHLETTRGTPGKMPERTTERPPG